MVIKWNDRDMNTLEWIAGFRQEDICEYFNLTVNIVKERRGQIEQRHEEGWEKRKDRMSYQEYVDNIAEDHFFFEQSFDQLFYKAFVPLWFSNVEQALREMLGTTHLVLRRGTENEEELTLSKPNGTSLNSAREFLEKYEQMVGKEESDWITNHCLWKQVQAVRLLRNIITHTDGIYDWRNAGRNDKRFVPTAQGILERFQIYELPNHIQYGPKPLPTRYPEGILRLNEDFCRYLLQLSADFFTLHIHYLSGDTAARIHTSEPYYARHAD